jgi:hypothetical protein
VAGVIFSTDEAAVWRKILSNLFSFPSSTLAGQPALGLQQCIPTRRAAVPVSLSAIRDDGKTLITALHSNARNRIEMKKWTRH